MKRVPKPPRCLGAGASLRRGFNGGCRRRDGAIGRAEVDYGAAIGLSTPVPRGLGGGASRAAPPTVTFGGLECGPFKENTARCGKYGRFKNIGSFQFYGSYYVVITTARGRYYL